MYFIISSFFFFFSFFFFLFLLLRRAMISISEFVDCNNYLLAIDTAADMQIIIIIKLVVLGSLVILRYIPRQNPSASP